MRFKTSQPTGQPSSSHLSEDRAGSVPGLVTSLAIQHSVIQTCIACITENKCRHERWETMMQFNIDGYPSDSPDATQYFGTEAEKLGVTMMLLQDTRRTEYSGTALTRRSR